MPSREQQFSIHPALGGLDVSSDASVLDPNFLTIAQNVEYLEGGQRRKRSGTAVYSTGLTSTGTGTLLASTSGAMVRAVSDMWRYGATLSPTQQILAVASKSIFYSTGDGAWTAASATSSFGSSGSSRTTITLAGDYAVINDGDPLSTSPPVAWDQTTLHTFTSSGGSGLPIYTGASYHVNRLWTGGLSTAPSQVNFTAANNIFDSTGGDTGGFTVDVGDGDQVMGLSRTFYGSIYIFKGPQFGSVHQLSGNDSTTFALAKVAHGAPLLNPRALISTPTDIFWISNYGVHSLQTTVKFGNVEEAFLSLPIQKLWRDRILDRPNLGKAWGFWIPERSIVGWAVYPSGSARQTWMLTYNYALSDPKPGGKKFWAIWVFPFGITSGAQVLVPAGWPYDTTHTGDPHPWFGGDDGQVYVGGQDTSEDQYNDAGDAISMSIRTPVITRYPSPGGATPETQEKQHMGVVTYFFPYASGTTATLTVTIDRRVQTYTIDLTGGGDRLDIDFFLDSSVLGGADFNYFETIIEDRGRSIMLQWDQTGLNQVMELFGYSVRYYPAELTAKEQV
jgi:hypothetical protein